MMSQHRMSVFGLAVLTVCCLYASLLPASGVRAQAFLSGQAQQLPDILVWGVAHAIQDGPPLRDVFTIAVEVPPDHHGYLDKGEEGFLIPFAFAFPALEEHGGQVVSVAPPAGQRDALVHATVLRGHGEFVFQLEQVPRHLVVGSPVATTVRYQICNDKTHVCYPPQERNVQLQFPAATGGAPQALKTAATAPAAPPSLTWNERITALFQRSLSNRALAFSLVWITGVLATATPCVYPVLPVTAAILLARGAGSRRQGRVHAVAYVLGLIAFYTLLGAVAATTGSALSAIMTNAWVNLGFAGLFTYFACSMFGFYEFQISPALIAKLDMATSRLGGLSGTFCMGLTAGLVVSPCVGPVTGAILLDITGQTGVASAVSGAPGATPWQGVFYMTAFGMGLGLPFLLVGLLSHRLPQSGQWLSTMKGVLGIPILYFAYTYYLKGMETLGVPSAATHAMLAGALAIGGAIFLGALHPLETTSPPPVLLRRTLGIVLLVVGVYLLYNGLGQSGVLPHTSSTVTSGATPATAPGGSAPTEVHGNLQWLRDFAAAQQRARTERKPLFVDFYATWCANCKAFQSLTLRDTRLNQALQDVVLVKIYDTDPIFRTLQQEPHYPELRGIGGQPLLPLFAIYTAQGTFHWKGQDYQAVQTMVAQLEAARRQAIP